MSANVRTATTRLVRSSVLRRAGVQRRAFHPAQRRDAATNFAMPALSPTMTEGNIGSWKIKEGDSFSAGDVILEIETDKAQMDVEAPDDGILAKILVGNGEKGVKVGTRIAVLAEEGDDLASLEIPEDTASAAKQTEKEPVKEAPKEEKKETTPPAETPKQSQPVKGAQFTPSPSVAHLLKEKGISPEEAAKIPASGPKGRLLKGDILAHLGKINKSRPRELGDAIHKLGKLDLSNIKIKQPAPKPAAAAAKAPEPPKEIKISIPLNVSELHGESASLVIAQATELANADLPTFTKSPSQLFDEILGAKPRVSTSTGAFVPVVHRDTKVVQPDIYDILTGKVSPRAKARVVSVGEEKVTVTVTAKEDERRARVFLERFKEIVEGGPTLL